MKYLIYLLLLCSTSVQAQNLRAFGSPSSHSLMCGKWSFIASNQDTGASILLQSDDKIRLVSSANNIWQNFVVASTTAAARRGILNFTRSRGTLASPTAVTNGDILGSIIASAHTGTNVSQTAIMSMVVDGTVTSGNAPTGFTFTTNGSEKMRLTSDGRFGLGITPNSSAFAHYHKDQNAATMLFFSNNNVGNQARAEVRIGTDQTNVSTKYGTMMFLGDGNTFIGGITKANTFLLEGNGANMILSNQSATEPIQFATLSTRTERARFTPSGSLLINSTGGANIDPRRLYVNGSIGANKDSIPVVVAITNEKILIQDTTTGQVKRIAMAGLPSGGSDGQIVTMISGSPAWATPIALASGTYTPTVIAATNVDANTPYACQYLRVGNTVTVSGKIDVDCTTASTGFSLELTLPITSNFVNSEEAGGTGAYPFGINAYGIRAKPSASRIILEGIAETDTNMTITFQYTYQIK